MTFTAGQKLRASDLAVLAAIRTTDLPRTNNTVTADTVLTVPLEANAAYDFHGALLYQRGAGSMVIGFTAPSGATYSWCSGSLASSVSTASGSVERSDHITSTVELGGITTSNVWAFPAGYVITSTTAGALTLTWAQSSTNATAAILRAGSRLIAQRIS